MLTRFLRRHSVLTIVTLLFVVGLSVKVIQDVTSGQTGAMVIDAGVGACMVWRLALDLEDDRRRHR